MKGQQGRYGELGDPGESVSCDLYTPKKRRFRLEKEVKAEKYEVDNEVVEILHLIWIEDVLILNGLILKPKRKEEHTQVRIMNLLLVMY